MNRSDFFFRQKVTEGEIDTAFQYAEDADLLGMVDLGFLGAVTGLVASQHVPLGLSVDVTGGAARSPLGERIYVPSTQQINLSTDWQNVSTAVSLAGNSKIVSIFVKFSRALQNPRTDGNGNNVYYDRLETFRWYVKQGAEAVAPLPPALEPDGILLADVTLVAGQTQILDTDVRTTRRQDVVVTTGAPFTMRVGSYLAAFQALTSVLNGIITGGGFQLTATSVIYAGSGPWVSGQPGIAAGSLEAAIDSLVVVLAATGAGVSAAHKLGCAPLVGPSSTIAAGPLFATLTALKSAANIEYAGSGAFADGSVLPASSTEGAIDNVVSFLGSTVVPGAARAGMKAVGNFTATTVFGAFGELAAATAGNDGMKRLGAEVKGGFTTSTGRGQLDELDVGWGKLARPNTWTGAQTVDNITASGATHYKLASRSITRMQNGLYSTPAAKGATVTLPFVIPHGAVLTAISVYFVPGAHVAWPPTTKAAFLLIKVDQTTGVGSFVAAPIDPAGTLAASNLTRAIVVSSLNDTMDRTTSVYFMQFTNESGINAQSCSMLGVSVTYTTTSLDDGY